jgi:hypothetical protein
MKLQECCSQYALYCVKSVRDKQGTHGPKAEQNHSSLKAVAGGHKNCSLEKNITDIMKCTGFLRYGKRHKIDNRTTSNKLMLRRPEDFSKKFKGSK